MAKRKSNNDRIKAVKKEINGMDIYGIQKLEKQLPEIIKAAKAKTAAKGIEQLTAKMMEHDNKSAELKAQIKELETLLADKAKK